VSNLFAYDLDEPKWLANANCTPHTAPLARAKDLLPEHCSVPKNRTFGILTGNVAVNCVKDKPGSVKSLCVNKLGEIAQ
jgi:hypothetical protein